MINKVGLKSSYAQALITLCKVGYSLGEGFWIIKGHQGWIGFFTMMDKPNQWGG